MKVLQINSVCGIRSTGRICTDITAVLKEDGNECVIAYGREDVPEKYRDMAFRIGGDLDVKLHAALSRLFDTAGFHSKAATKKLLKYIDDYAPDIIHLHNIHGYYLNIELLFAYIKRKNIPTVWTLHDCWAFTGHCSHYSAVGCEKWKTGCEGCPQKGEYPKSILLDRSKKNYAKKKDIFCGVPNLTIVTPSRWLADEVKSSFLGDYRIEVIPNGIDLSVFKPTESDFRARYGLENKKIVLGVATAWGDRKGLPDFYKLSEKLGADYQIVLVGLTQEQSTSLPTEIIGIQRTNSAEELTALYTAADLHLSFSREETMGLTLIEANACGTPVMARNKTALPEIVTEKTGICFEGNDIDAIAKTITETDLSNFNERACVDFAENFEKKSSYLKYVDIYKELFI